MFIRTIRTRRITDEMKNKHYYKAAGSCSGQGGCQITSGKIHARSVTAIKVSLVKRRCISRKSLIYSELMQDSSIVVYTGASSVFVAAGTRKQ